MIFFKAVEKRNLYENFDLIRENKAERNFRFEQPTHIEFIHIVLVIAELADPNSSIMIQ